MSPRSRLPLALALFAPLAAGIGMAPSPARGQARPADRFEDVSRVVSVEVPINAVGRDGRPIRGLTKDDFEIFDDGKKQEITSFEMIDLDVLSPASNPQERARAEQLGAPGRRHFLLLFDLTFSSVPAILKARTAARDFVLNSLAPTDLAAVATVSLEHGPRLVVTFTPDRAQLARGIDTLGSKSQLASDRSDPLRFVIDRTELAAIDASNSGQGQLPDLRDQRAGGALADYLGTLTLMGQKNQRMFDSGRVVAMSQTLASVAKTLHGLKGRKHVILFSEGFDSRLLLGRGAAQVDDAVREAQEIATGQSWMTDLDNRYGNTELQNEINRMLDEFRRADCVIQAVDIGGLRAAGRDTDVARSGSGKEALFYLANETGGELYEDANNLTGQLDKLLERTSITYLVAFERADLKEDGTFHRLRVKANLPPGARLSHRRGYYAPRPFKDLDPLEKNLLAAEGIASATQRRDLDLNVLVASFRAAPNLAYVPVIIEVGGARLLTGQTGEQLGLEFYTYVSDAQGQMRDFFTHQVGISLGASREAIRRTGVKYYGHLELPPGSYRVRVLVRNAETGLTGVESVALEVPAFAESHPELLPPMFIEAPGTWVLVREREASGQRSVVYPFTLKGEPYIPAAKPELSATRAARLCLVAYNLGPGDLAIAGRVVDGDGREVEGGSLELVERTATGIAGLDKLVATFQPRGLKAGGYVLQVAVTDPASGARETNSLPFVVN